MCFETKFFFQVFIAFPAMVGLAAIYLIAAPFSENPLQSFFCLLFICAGIPVYFAFVYYKLSPSWLERGLGKFSYLLSLYRCNLLHISPSSENVSC